MATNLARIYPLFEPLVFEMFTETESLDKIRAVLDVLWSRHPEVPTEAIRKTELACVEIGRSIIGQPGSGRATRMRITAQVSRGQVCVEFDDDGHPVVIDASSATAPAELAERGRGLAIAAAVLDELQHSRDGSTNHWTLTCRIPAVCRSKLA